MVTKGTEAADISVSSFEIVEPEEPLSCYQKEWMSLFSSKYYREQLKLSAIKGTLKASHFRSVCWKVFLKCLPNDRQQWIDEVNLQRQCYEEILDKFNTNPRAVDSLDINVNNPLSQSQQNPWNQYFQDTELKVTIQQDVVRTFPEIEFFHTPDIQNMMSTILFSYAREFPDISYRQGMHELLAPIIFVLHYDQQAYLQASETEKLEYEIHILLNKNYIEHDAFFLFSKLMHVVEPWYTMSECSSKYEILTAVEPFTHNSIVPGNLLGGKLNRIHKHLLKHHDTQLFLHLEQMEIEPQIFGIRWLRLLFGREFSIHDLLIIWDAIFADSSSFGLVDYIFIAMLISIRDLLLHDDYASCLNHLMRFPNVVDVHYIVNMALHLRDPDGVKKPDVHLVKILNPLQLKMSKNEKSTGNKDVSKGLYPGTAKNLKIQPSKNNVDNRPKTLSIAGINVLKNNAETFVAGARAKSSQFGQRAASPVCDSNDSSESLDINECSSEKCASSFTFPRTRIRNVMEHTNHKYRATEIAQTHSTEKNFPSETYREMVPFLPPSTSASGVESHASKSRVTSQKSTTEVTMLKKEISALKLMNAYCTQEISQHLEKLQENMMRESLQYEDEMFISLAGLKRARDILKGTICFTEEILNEEMNLYSSFSPNSKNSSEVSPEDEPEILELKTDNLSWDNVNKVSPNSAVSSSLELKAAPEKQSSDCVYSSIILEEQDILVSSVSAKDLSVGSKNKDSLDR